MIISIEAKENDRALLEFAKDMKDFKNYLNTKVQLPSKLLEVRSTISDWIVWSRNLTTIIVTMIIDRYFKINLYIEK